MILVCDCKTTIELTNIQYDEFDCGMMGRLHCPQCGTTLMPSHRRNVNVKEIDVDFELKST